MSVRPSKPLTVPLYAFLLYLPLVVVLAALAAGVWALVRRLA